MSKRSRQRRNRERQVLKYACQQEYRITDHHSRFSVVLRSPLRFLQLIRRGWMEQDGPMAGKLMRCFQLTSNELAENGEPKLKALRDEIIWPVNQGCPTASICEALWMMSGHASFTLAEAEAAVAARLKEIERETQWWGLPPRKAPRVREDWGSFGQVEYA